MSWGRPSLLPLLRLIRQPLATCAHWALITSQCELSRAIGTKETTESEELITIFKNMIYLIN